MKTVPTILPIYDSVEKQDQNRTGTKMPILTPRFKLPSLLWNVQSESPGEITDVELINNTGATYFRSLYNDWINHGGWDTFTHSGLDILSAINAAGSEIADIALNGAYEIAANAGDIITVRGLMNYTGTAPHLSFRQDDAEIQNSTMANGNYSVTFTVTADCDLSIALTVGGATNFSFLNVEVGIANINEYFNISPPYIQNGGGAGWINNATGYDTFTSVNKNITSAIKTTAAGVASCWNVVASGSVSTTITAGESIRIKAVLTLNSGTSPKCVLQRTDTSANISNVVTLSAGTNYFFLTATSTITGFAIAFYNANGELTNYSLVLSLGEKSIIPKLYTALTDDYYQYKGDTLGLLLPLGSWYLKITTLNNIIYYSDWFVVSEIYRNLISAFINADYNTFTSLGTTIVSAIETGGSGRVASSSTGMVTVKGEIITAIFYATVNSGQLPKVRLTDNLWGSDISNIIDVKQGLNIATFTTTVSCSDTRLWFSNSSASDFVTTEVILIRSYSSSFIKISFSDTHDLGEILYQDGLTQEVYFEQKLAPPTHEVVEVGEEKNGIFVAEKIITKYKYRIIANVGRELYKALIRLPQHDTISITDEVGNVYTPKVGNVQVIPANWIYYDVCRLEIIFNDNTEYVWTSENNNIT